jgi:hypothetical protein
MLWAIRCVVESQAGHDRYLPAKVLQPVAHMGRGRWIVVNRIEQIQVGRDH